MILKQQPQLPSLEHCIIGVDTRFPRIIGTRALISKAQIFWDILLMFYLDGAEPLQYVASMYIG